MGRRAWIEVDRTGAVQTGSVIIVREQEPKLQSVITRSDLVHSDRWTMRQLDRVMLASRGGPPVSRGSAQRVSWLMSATKYPPP